jgi:hypothetical protein
MINNKTMNLSCIENATLIACKRNLTAAPNDQRIVTPNDQRIVTH